MIFCSYIVNSQETEVLTNEKIIKLHQAVFSNEVLKSKIQTSLSKFDVTMNGLMTLKKAGISDAYLFDNICVSAGFSQTKFIYLKKCYLRNPDVCSFLHNNSLYYLI